MSAPARRQAEPVDWWRVARRCKNAVAVACFVAGVGIGAVTIHGLATTPRPAAPVPMAPSRPHGGYELTFLTPTPTPHPVRAQHSRGHR